MPTRIVAIDGHTLTLAGLAVVVAGQPDLELVGECRLAQDVDTVVAAAQPTVVLVDVLLADGDGLAVAAALRGAYPGLGIVLLASHEEDGLLFRAIEAGVSAFVPKTAPVADLLGAIRYAAVAPASFIAAGLPDALAKRRRTERAFALSPREHEVLVLLGDGLSIPAIAATLYVSMSTAKTYVSRLYEKLHVSNRSQALMTAIRTGLLAHGAESATSAAG
ncbi:response regulator transcription factor [Labedaea rhizosphaerae]|uniref:LuxR family two component transcriptional regulator n=1 Tax=Labedaea rhizosphaerae TaxID=598644 RepID=A0A4R6SB28_LABRH|nr:response regulator transcription factor [Labedaea rhizosphaerae]TDP96764.1 LuxR family two component transcriptional regulator [Labedaea rhizosphaerae]